MSENQVDPADRTNWTKEGMRLGWSLDESDVRRRAEMLKRELAPVGDQPAGRFADPAAITGMRTEMASLQAAIAQYESARATAQNTAATEEDTESREREARENSTWYIRRFYTSQGLVSAAAFAGVAAHVVGGEATGYLAAAAVLLFAVATILAGLIPLVSGYSINLKTGEEHPTLGRWTTKLSAYSAAAFLMGLVCVVIGLGDLALRPRLDAGANRSTPLKTVKPPTAPSATLPASNSPSSLPKAPS